MQICCERLSICIGSIFLGWALVAIGYQWALWAVRTGRIKDAITSKGEKEP